MLSEVDDVDEGGVGFADESALGDAILSFP